MNILIATPCYGGLVYSDYMMSILGLTDYFNENKVSYEIMTLAGESLITRGRNKCAWYALANSFDKLFFIDADLTFTTEDFVRIMKSDKFIVGGTYPIKEYPLRLNFNLLDTDIETYRNAKTDEEFLRFKKDRADEMGEVEVKHIPTGFMMIDCAVLRHMKEKAPSYIGQSPLDGQKVTMWDLFPTQVRNGIHESEDWAFCSNAREMGFSSYLNTNVVVTHIGSHHFKVALSGK